MQNLRTFWEISGVLIFDFIEITIISLEFKYSRVLSLCSAPSCHHYKWSCISNVIIFGSQDLPSTSAQDMSEGRWWCLLTLPIPSLIEIEKFGDCYFNWFECDEALHSEAQHRSEDEKSRKVQMKLESWGEVKIHGKENQMPRWRLRSWSFGQKESLRKKVRQAEAETETQSAEPVEEFEAKRDLGSEA